MLDLKTTLLKTSAGPIQVWYHPVFCKCDGELVFLGKMHNPTSKTAPYITGVWSGDSEDGSYIWGRYDLSLERALNQISERSFAEVPVESISSYSKAQIRNWEVSDEN